MGVLVMGAWGYLRVMMLMWRWCGWCVCALSAASVAVLLWLCVRIDGGLLLAAAGYLDTCRFLSTHPLYMPPGISSKPATQPWRSPLLA